MYINYTFPPWENIPKPQKEELLSSWLTRIAIFYHISLKELLSKHFRKYLLYYRDIDLTNIPLPILDKLSYLTQTPIHKLQSLQLLKLEGKIQKSIQVGTRNRWIITTSNNGNIQLRASNCLRICTLCLKENNYYPIISKLLFINVCCKHRTYFIDSCQKCKSPIMPTKLSPPKKIYQCFMCGFDLRKSTISTAFKKDIETTMFLQYSIKKNWIKHQDKDISVLDYFTVLYLISKNLHKIFPNDKVFLLQPQINMLSKGKSHYLIYQPIPYIAQIISLSHYLIFDSWDDKLLDFIKCNRLMYVSQLLNKRGNIQDDVPLWFLKHMKRLWIT